MAKKKTGIALISAGFLSALHIGIVVSMPAGALVVIVSFIIGAWLYYKN